LTAFAPPGIGRLGPEGAAAAAPDPEMSMTDFRPRAGRSRFVRCVLALILNVGAGSAPAAERFPFDRTLVLDTAPMPPVKRVPLLTVEEDGEATIGLWCKTVRGRVEVNGAAIRIEAEPLPEALPRYMVDGQCTEERMRADQDMLAALTQATGWRRQGEGVVLEGPLPLRFRASDH
jgi:hypothetical protein